jgi:quinol monooxygenase YgiN
MSISAGVAFAGVLVAAVGTGVLGGRCIRSPRASFIVWTVGMVALTAALLAQSIGFATGFGPLTFRVIQLGAQLVAPLWFAWGLVELAARSVAVRFGAKLAAGGLTIVAGVVLATDPLTARPFSKTWPAASVHYQVIPHDALNLVHVVAVIAAVAAAGTCAARARGDPGQQRIMAGAAAVGVAVLLTVVLRLSLPAGSAYPALSGIAAGLMWFGMSRMDGPYPGEGRGRRGARRLAGGRRGAPDRGYGTYDPDDDLRDSGDDPRDPGRAGPRRGRREFPAEGGRYAPDPYAPAPVYPGDEYPGDGYRGDGYPRNGYQGDGYQGDGYQGDGYQGDGYQGDGYRAEGYRGDGYRGDGYPGDRYQGAGFRPGERPGGEFATQRIYNPGLTGAEPATGAIEAPGAALGRAPLPPGPRGRAPGAVGAPGTELARPPARPHGMIAIYTLLEDKVADFDRIAEEAAEQVRANEPDTLVYVIHTVPKAAMQRIFYEVYRDRDAFERHEQQPYIKRFVTARRPYVLATNVIELRLKYAKVSPLTPPDPRARANGRPPAGPPGPPRPADPRRAEPGPRGDPYGRPERGPREDPYARPDPGLRADPYARPGSGPREDPYARPGSGPREDPYGRPPAPQRRYGGI